MERKHVSGFEQVLKETDFSKLNGDCRLTSNCTLFEKLILFQYWKMKNIKPTFVPCRYIG